MGKFRGKVGSVVMRVRDGKQIASEYQPVVSNPKSEAQTLQRARINLAGRLSHVITSDIIMFEGMNKSRSRAFLQKVLINGSEANRVQGQQASAIVANIIPENIILAKGSAVQMLPNVGLQVAGEDITVSLPQIMNYRDASVPSFLHVVILLASDNPDYPIYVMKEEEVKQNNTPGAAMFSNSVTISVSSSLMGKNYTAYGYAYYGIGKVGSASAAYDGITGTEQELSASVNLMFAQGAMDVSDSVFCGAAKLDA